MARSRSAEPARRAPLTALFALFALAGLAPPAAPEPDAAPLAFARHSEPVAMRDLAWLRQAVPPARVRVYEPYEAREVEFEALRFERVLDAVYGEAWRREEELLFTCRDGYQPTIPVARVLAHRAWLAFARVDPPDFAIRKLESGSVRRIELGPFYLVWENLDDERIRQEADYGWPYQLVGVDLIRSRERFPGLTPPAGSSQAVLEGFAAFRVHCSKCHELNGEGGRVGPELLGAKGPLAVRERDWLRTWIEEPSRIRPQTRMEPLNPALPDRARVVERILAYLEAMAAAGGAGGR